MHPTRGFGIRHVVTLAAVFAIAACSEPVTNTDAPGALDAAADVGVDTTLTDALTDGATDAPNDLGRDAPSSADVEDAANDASPIDVPVTSDVPTEDASACDRPGMPPDLAGTNACTTLDFGRAAVPVRDVTTPIVFTGGTIPPGIYDVVDYQRTSGTLMTTMRATLVISSDGRFTEVRLLDTGSGTSPTTRKSGTFATSGNSLVRMVSCGGADAGFETNMLTYRVDCDPSGVLLHMGLTNLWFTYRRR